MGASPAAACVAATVAYIKGGAPRDGTAVASILKTGGGLTSAAGDSAGSVDGVVSSVPACHQALRIMSVTPCKQSSEGWGNVFLTELYHCGTHKPGTFKAAVFQRAAGTSAVACLFPADFGDTHRVYAFDPTPHPEFGLNGPSFLTFTSLRGLQLHLQRVFGGEGKDRPDLNGSDFVCTILRQRRNRMKRAAKAAQASHAIAAASGAGSKPAAERPTEAAAASGDVAEAKADTEDRVEVAAAGVPNIIPAADVTVTSTLDVDGGDGMERPDRRKPGPQSSSVDDAVAVARLQAEERRAHSEDIERRRREAESKQMDEEEAVLADDEPRSTDETVGGAAAVRMPEGARESKDDRDAEDAAAREHASSGGPPEGAPASTRRSSERRSEAKLADEQPRASTGNSVALVRQSHTVDPGAPLVRMSYAADAGAPGVDLAGEAESSSKLAEDDGVATRAAARGGVDDSDRGAGAARSSATGSVGAARAVSIGSVDSRQSSTDGKRATEDAARSDLPRAGAPREEVQDASTGVGTGGAAAHQRVDPQAATDAQPERDEQVAGQDGEREREREGKHAESSPRLGFPGLVAGRGATTDSGALDDIEVGQLGRAGSGDALAGKVEEPDTPSSSGGATDRASPQPVEAGTGTQDSQARLPTAPISDFGGSEGGVRAQQGGPEVAAGGAGGAPLHPPAESVSPRRQVPQQQSPVRAPDSRPSDGTGGIADTGASAASPSPTRPRTGERGSRRTDSPSGGGTRQTETRNVEPGSGSSAVRRSRTVAPHAAPATGLASAGSGGSVEPAPAATPRAPRVVSERPAIDEPGSPASARRDEEQGVPPGPRASGTGTSPSKVAEDDRRSLRQSKESEDEGRVRTVRGAADDEDTKDAAEAHEAFDNNVGDHERRVDSPRASPGGADSMALAPASPERPDPRHSSDTAVARSEGKEAPASPERLVRSEAKDEATGTDAPRDDTAGAAVAAAAGAGAASTGDATVAHSSLQQLRRAMPSAASKDRDGEPPGELSEGKIHDVGDALLVRQSHAIEPGAPLVRQSYAMGRSDSPAAPTSPEHKTDEDGVVADGGGVDASEGKHAGSEADDGAAVPVAAAVTGRSGFGTLTEADLRDRDDVVAPTPPRREPAVAAAEEPPAVRPPRDVTREEMRETTLGTADGAADRAPALPDSGRAPPAVMHEHIDASSSGGSPTRLARPTESSSPTVPRPRVVADEQRVHSVLDDVRIAPPEPRTDGSVELAAGLLHERPRVGHARVDTWHNGDVGAGYVSPATSTLASPAGFLRTAHGGGVDSGHAASHRPSGGAREHLLRLEMDEARRRIEMQDERKRAEWARQRRRVGQEAMARVFARDSGEDDYERELPDNYAPSPSLAQSGTLLMGSPTRGGERASLAAAPASVSVRGSADSHASSSGGVAPTLAGFLAGLPAEDAPAVESGVAGDPNRRSFEALGEAVASALRQLPEYSAAAPVPGALAAAPPVPAAAVPAESPPRKESEEAPAEESQKQRVRTPVQFDISIGGSSDRSLSDDDDDAAVADGHAHGGAAGDSERKQAPSHTETAIKERAEAERAGDAGGDDGGEPDRRARRQAQFDEFRRRKLAEAARRREMALARKELSRREHERAAIKSWHVAHGDQVDTGGAAAGDPATVAGSRLPAPSVPPVTRARAKGASSNRARIRNAVKWVLLPGFHRQEELSEALAALERDPSPNLIVLLRSSDSLAYKALYSYDPASGQILLIHGHGPRSLTSRPMSNFYKYDTGSRKFTALPTKEIGVTTDAVVLVPRRKR